MFLLVAVVWLRIRPAAARLGDRSFVAVGAVSGFGSALLGSVGPMVAPFFLARGLTRGAYIGTEASAAVVMHVTKLLVFGAAAVLTWMTVADRVLLAPASAAGAYAGKRVVDHMPVHLFTAVVEIGLLVAGVLLILGV